MFFFFALFLFIFCIGAAIGSFLNVVVDRIVAGQSLIYPPSHCPHCRHRLHPFDLIPIISYIILNGKCRYCKKEISFYYPTVEIVTGFLFVITFYMLNERFVLFAPDAMNLISSNILFTIAYYFLIISSLIIIFFADLKYGIIPFKVIILAVSIIFLRHLYLLVTGQEQLIASYLTPSFFNFLFSGLSSFLLFLFLFLITKGKGMGFGDVVYAFFMGLLIGFPDIIVSLYIAFLTGAAISLILVLLRRKKFIGGIIPFGPFLVLGTFVCLFWGDSIINQFVLYLLH